MGDIAQIITWVYVPTNALGKFLLTWIGMMPGWLSITIISAITGVILLLIFKHTSNQNAIGLVRDNINANMLVLKLFKDSLAVTLQALMRIFKGTFLLLLHAIKPLTVMIVPVWLLLGQMGLWYQYRPLLAGEETVVTMEINGEAESAWPDVQLTSLTGAQMTMGPIKVLSKRELLWKIKALENGHHNISFLVDHQKIEKKLAIGDGFMRVSLKRPGWKWKDILLHPLEKPFGPDAIVQSITIDYPDRISRISGTNWWIIYFFAVSLIVSLIFKPVMKVRI